MILRWNMYRLLLGSRSLPGLLELDGALEARHPARLPRRESLAARREIGESIVVHNAGLDDDDTRKDRRLGPHGRATLVAEEARGRVAAAANGRVSCRLARDERKVGPGHDPVSAVR